jgi:hypothetical protein
MTGDGISMMLGRSPMLSIPAVSNPVMRLLPESTSTGQPGWMRGLMIGPSGTSVMSSNS